ncbi:MAG: hypothetical protein AAFR56_22235 [Chloroflexota bacterium]
MIILSACGASTAEDDPPALPTLFQTPVPDAEEAPADAVIAEAVDNVTPEVTSNETPEVTDGTGLNIIINNSSEMESDIPPSNSESGAYSLTAVRISSLEAGTRQYLLDATVLNQSAADITVADGSIALVTEAGERFSPVAMSDSIQPALIGATLALDESLRGFAQFEIPDGQTPSHIEWCVDDACEILLGSVVPFDASEF